MFSLRIVNASGVHATLSVAGFCVRLGILEKVEADPTRSDTVKLGLTMQTYAWTGDMTKLALFLHHARIEAIAPPRVRVSTPGDADGAIHRAYADKVCDAIRIIGIRGARSGLSLYVMVRKMHLAGIAISASTCETSCTLKRLCVFFADPKEREHFLELPEDWTAAQASDFMCGRSDWGLFVPMYMPMWKEVADAANLEDDYSKKQMLFWILHNKKTLVSVATHYRSTFGMSPHPWDLMIEVGWLSTYQRRVRKRLSVSESD